MTSRKRAAIYARFSTELQNERSIDDQIALCRDFAARENIDIAAVWSDKARSGGSTIGRDGLQDLLAQAHARAFDVLIVEALDRLSRDMEDLAGIHKRLTFLGIEIRAVHEGRVDTVLVGLRGLIGQLYREDNVHKIRRGMQGRAKDGLCAGGLTYGYKTVPGHVGKRVIDQAEAAIVQRIFREYAAGATPRDIAIGLNRERVPAQRGALWNASSINGSRQRGNGILHNDIYGGRMIWNRVKMVRDPDTGRRLSRPNPESQWTIVDVPELAIVPPELFARVRKRLEERGGDRPEFQVRPKRILSGLLRCGACGAGMSTRGKDKSGRVRIHCSGHMERGSCPAPTTYYLDTIEQAVLDGLRKELRDPAMMAEYVREYHAERERLNASTIRERATLEKRLATIGAEADRITTWLIKGIGDVARLDARAKEIMAEEADLKRQLAEAEAPVRVVALHPNVIARYEQQLARLDTAFGKALDYSVFEAADALRDLIDTVTLRRPEPGVIDIEIDGSLNALLGPEAYPTSKLRVGGDGGSGGGI